MRLRKLRAMSVSEMAGRARYGAFVTWERLRLAGTRRDRSGLDVNAVRRRLRHATGHEAEWLLTGREAPPAFFPGVEESERVRRLFRSVYGCELEKARHHAAAVRRHEIAFFGETFRYGGAISWQADPVSGREWPRVFHRDVPIHDPETPFGDVKYVWELNRHQFLVDLAKAHFLDGNSVDAAEVGTIVRSWTADNPVGVGVNWACALEPAFRAFSWLWAYRLCDSGRALDPETRLIWLAAFHDHGRFLHRHLEYYASPFNHLIGEAAALYALGLMFPVFREASAWRRRGRLVLEGTVNRQFHPDGGSVEQSTFYHHATLGFYLLAALLGRANGEELAPAVWHAVERGIGFSMSLMQPDGRTPPIGGADDGKSIRLEHLPLWDFRPFLAVGAVLFSRSDFKHAARRFHEDALWLLGPDGFERFGAIAAEPAAEASRALEHSGYYILRSDWSDTADYVCFDCGEQAAGVRSDGVPTAVHGHADCLSVIVHLGGRPVLVDPGFFSYNGDKAWRDHFRQTAAHNTVEVDATSQASYVGKMAWARAYTPGLEAWVVDVEGARVVGAHDGYARLDGGVRHRRVAWLRPEGYAIVCDELTGEGEHTVRLNYQFAPGDVTWLGPEHLLFESTVELAWSGSVPVAASCEAGGQDPGRGWIAPSLGVRVPAPRVVLELPFAAPRTVLLTVVARRVIAGATRIQRADGLGAAAFEVLGSGRIDLVVAGDRPPREGQSTTVGELVTVSRLRGDGRQAARPGRHDIRRRDGTAGA